MRPLIASTILLVLPALGFAQGALTPPSGAPAPTMKTLDQLEPRTPLKAGAPGVTQNTNGGFTITASGSYYLTANLTIASGDAIVITASGVSLDLSGFTISSTTASPTASGTAVYIYPNLSDITIRNGNIRGNTVYDAATKIFSGTGFKNGIRGSLSDKLLADNIFVGNVAIDGISDFTTIDHCAASVCGGLGLRADHVRDSSAYTCGTSGVMANYTASNCYGSSTGGGSGISADTASNCYGSSRGVGAGLIATTASNCYGSSTSGTGLSAYTASNCYGSSTSGTGLDAHDTASNCSGSSLSSTGLDAGDTASNCRGYSTSGTGLWANKSATGCYGKGAAGIYVGDRSIAGTAENCRGDAQSGTGIYAETATNCFGTSDSGTGLRASTATNCTAYTASGTYAMSVAGSATNCRGNNDKAGGIAIQAAIAVSCTTAGGTIVAPQKFLGTP
jgi:hypothetical protein